MNALVGAGRDPLRLHLPGLSPSTSLEHLAEDPIEGIASWASCPRSWRPLASPTRSSPPWSPPPAHLARPGRQDRRGGASQPGRPPSAAYYVHELPARPSPTWPASTACATATSEQGRAAPWPSQYRRSPARTGFGEEAQAAASMLGAYLLSAGAYDKYYYPGAAGPHPHHAGLRPRLRAAATCILMPASPRTAFKFGEISDPTRDVRCRTCSPSPTTSPATVASAVPLGLGDNSPPWPRVPRQARSWRRPSRTGRCSDLPRRAIERSFDAAGPPSRPAFDRKGG